MSLFDKLSHDLQRKVLKFLNCIDIINFCDALPNMKWVLNSSIFTNALCAYLNKVNWLDSFLYDAFPDSPMDISNERLVEAIKHCEEEKQFHAHYLNRNPIQGKRFINILIISSVEEYPFTSKYFFSTLCNSMDESGLLIFRLQINHHSFKRFFGSMSSYEILVDIYTSEFTTDELFKVIYRFSRTSFYHCVLYAVNSAPRSHFWSSGSRDFVMIQNAVTKLTRVRPPLIAVLDTHSLPFGTVSESDDRCNFIYLKRVTSCIGFTLNRGTTTGANIEKSSRVWRLRRESEKFVNLMDVIRWAVTIVVYEKADLKGPLFSQTCVDIMATVAV